MNEIGKMMVIGGLILAGIGGLLWLGVGKSWPGRLPGDIQVTRDSFNFYFPVVTCLIVSVVLTFILWLFRR